MGQEIRRLTTQKISRLTLLPKKFPSLLHRAGDKCSISPIVLATDMTLSKGIQKMEIKQSGSQPSAKESAEYFIGTVRIDPLFSAPDPACTSGASVTFEAGARTAWHTHPLGQTPIVTAGCGLVQR